MQLLALLLAGCGAATPHGSESAHLLRLRPPPHARYELIVRTDTVTQALPDRVVRSTVRGTAVVTERAPALEYTIELASMERVAASSPVILPPQREPFEMRLVERLDARGRRLSVDLDGDAERAALASSVRGSLTFAREPVHIGSRWEEHDEQGVATTYRLEAFEGEVARLGVRRSAEGSELTGTTWVALDDGSISRSTGRLELAEDPEAPDAPHIVAFEICMQPEGDRRLGCGDARTPQLGEEAGETAPRAAVYEGEACVARAAAIERGLELIAQEGGGFAPHVALPEASGGDPTLAPGHVLEVLGDRIGLDGREVARADLETELESITLQYDIDQRPPEQRVMYLLLDRQARLADVRSILERASAFGAPRLVIERDSGAEPPRMPQWVGAVLGAASQSGDASRGVTEVLSVAIGLCDPLVYALAMVADPEAPERAARMPTMVGEALRTCRCEGVDIDAIGAVMQPPRRVHRGLPFTIGRRGAAVRIGGQRTVAELATELARVYADEQTAVVDVSR